jgi:hypothetical protein
MRLKQILIEFSEEVDTFLRTGDLAPDLFVVLDDYYELKKPISIMLGEENVDSWLSNTFYRDVLREIAYEV